MSTAALLLFLLIKFTESFEVHVAPEGEVVLIVDGRFQATCHSSTTTISNVEWLINGTDLENSNIMNANVTKIFNTGFLFISQLLPQYNRTTIRCRADFQHSINSITIILQGTLAAVGSLSLTYNQDSTITLNWTAPFTHDITGGQDIEGYSVIVTRDFNSSNYTITNYTTTETSFLYTLPSDGMNACLSYLFTVYARNPAGDGDNSSVSYSMNQESSAVTSLELTPLQDSTVSITWTVPPSECLYEYTIIVNRTFIRTTILSHYDTYETDFVYTLPSLCSLYNFTVYAKNSAGDGNHSSRLYYFTTGVNQWSPGVTDIQRLSVHHATMNMEDFFDYSLTMSAEVCGARLIFMDRDTGNTTTLNNNDLRVVNDTISFNTMSLPLRRHFNITIKATINDGSAYDSYTNMSTHGILRATATKTESDAVHMTIDYYDQSTTLGALLSLQLDDDANFEKSILVILDRNAPPGTALTHVSYNGFYNIYAYDITSNRTLPIGKNYPADITGVNFPDNPNTSRNGTGKCTTSSDLYTITVKCETLSDPHAIGFQVIAQHTQKKNVLYVAESLNLQTPAVVQVESEGVYQITVLSVRQSSGILDSYTEYISQENIPPKNELGLPLGLSLGLFFLIVLIIAPVIVVVYREKIYAKYQLKTD